MKDINPIPCPWSFAINPKHKNNSYGFPIPKFQEYQYHNNISMQLSNSIPQRESSSQSEKAILNLYEVYIFNQPIHFDQLYHFAYKLPLEILSHTCHLYHLSTSRHYLVYPWYAKIIRCGCWWDESYINPHVVCDEHSRIILKII